MSDAVHDVNSAFSALHTNLTHMRTDAKTAKAIVENADKLMKDIRQSAVKAIHATSTCASGKHDDEDDEDEDHDDDNDKHSSRGNFIVVLFSNLQSLFGDRTVTVNTTTASASPSASASTSPNTTFSGDPKQIADQAIAAMQLVFDEASAQLSELATPSPRATKSPKGTKVDTSHGRSERSGKSGHGDREGDDD